VPLAAAARAHRRLSVDQVVEKAMMIKLMFTLIKLWFKLAVLLAGLLAGGLGGVLVGEILMRAGEIATGPNDRQPPAKTPASSPARRGHAQARSQT
jgi:hypothetical protein